MMNNFFIACIKRKNKKNEYAIDGAKESMTKTKSETKKEKRK